MTKFEIGQEVVHKILAIARVAPVPLSDLILCWPMEVATDPTVVVSKSINNVTCEECLRLWKSGVYA